MYTDKFCPEPPSEPLAKLDPRNFSILGNKTLDLTAVGLLGSEFISNCFEQETADTAKASNNIFLIFFMLLTIKI
ncbi:hypothetical protein D3C72_2452220 [compost metagenome]